MSAMCWLQPSGMHSISHRSLNPYFVAGADCIDINCLTLLCTSVDEALEGSVTCMDCLEIVTNAVHCPRCHHHGCHRCLDTDGSGHCKDCMADYRRAGRAVADIDAGMKAECTLRAVPAIDNIASKFGHRQQVTASLRSIIDEMFSIEELLPEHNTM